jgi:hypothetical protein
MKNYKFYADPGHGWLAVKRVELEALGIADKVSRYSYQFGNTVYLEEDCDAGLFFNAKGWKVWSDAPIVSKHTNNLSRIRSLSSYKP